MPTLEDINRLHDIVDALLERKGVNALARLSAPFDISRPNIHDSKTEFQLELATVGAMASALDKILIPVISGSNKEERPEKNAMILRLAAAIDESARGRLGDINADSVSNLLRKNAIDRSLFWTAVGVIFDLRTELSNRRKELKDQQREFWSVRHRPPNYYARTIALRLARLYARETGKKPTFGLARDGGHPSTDFGRALERVFDVLKIEATVRHPAEWAISKLTDEDYRPPSTGLLGGLLGLSDPPEEDPATSTGRQITLEDRSASKES